MECIFLYVMQLIQVKVLLFIFINGKLWAELMALSLLQLSNSTLQEAIIRPHILSKLVLCLMLHAGFPPQGGYFWEISDKIVFSVLLSGNIFFQNLRGPFFWIKV